MPTRKPTNRKKPTKLKLASSSRYSLKRMLPFLLVFAVVGTVMLWQTFAASPTPLTFYAPSNTQIDHIIEQQTTWVTGSTKTPPVSDDPSDWVVNPTSDCTWDADDHWKLFVSTRAYLDPGKSAEHQACLVAETDPIYATHYGISAWWSNAPRPIGTSITAASANLTVTLCYSPQGKCFTLVPRPAGTKGYYRYSGCIGVGYRADLQDPAIVEIPGSNGGKGVMTTATLKLANNTARQIKGIGGVIEAIPWGVKPTLDECDLSARPYQRDYPFQFSL
ncbi:MAG: hypothetical protein V4702_01055 [Patescibacteria group bacterium]